MNGVSLLAEKGDANAVVVHQVMTESKMLNADRACMEDEGRRRDHPKLNVAR